MNKLAALLAVLLLLALSVTYGRAKGPGALGATVGSSADIVIPDNPVPSAILVFDTVYAATCACYNRAYPERLTIPVDGWYIVSGSAMYAANTNGQRELFFKINDTRTTLAVNLVNATGGELRTRMTVTALHYFRAGEYVVMGAYQNSGGPLTIQGGEIQTPSFSIVQVPGMP